MEGSSGAGGATEFAAADDAAALVRTRAHAHLRGSTNALLKLPGKMLRAHCCLPHYCHTTAAVPPRGVSRVAAPTRNAPPYVSKMYRDIQVGPPRGGAHAAGG